VHDRKHYSFLYPGEFVYANNWGRSLSRQLLSIKGIGLEIECLDFHNLLHEMIDAYTANALITATCCCVFRFLYTLHNLLDYTEVQYAIVPGIFLCGGLLGAV
jgi:hypothetical protein